MAKLILTKEEKGAATWAELDDAALGKVVKAGMFDLKEIAEEQGKLLSMAAAIVLCSMASDANADKLNIDIDGLTIKGKAAGNWAIHVIAIIER